jgi:regulator of protease activity HflC (stomatin/prohibitin superfamily)
VFWLGVLAFAVAVFAIGAIFVTAGDNRETAIATAAIALIIGAGSWTVASYNRVPTQNAGIVTVFGKPTGEITGAGLKWKAPWKNIEDWDATRQSYNHLGDKCSQPGDGSIWVAISGQRNACIRVQINWKTATTEAAARNWAAYKKGNYDSRFDAFTIREVDPQFNDAIIATFRTFDPLALVDKTTGEAQAPDLAGTYGPRLLANINDRLSADIKVDSITWGLVGFDQATTSLISQYAQKVLDGRNLVVDKANAEQRAAIAKQTGIPAGVQQCLDLVKVMGKGEPGLCMNGSGVALTRSVG